MDEVFGERLEIELILAIEIKRERIDFVKFQGLAKKDVCKIK